MNEHLKYGTIFLALGLVGFLVGWRWKNPSFADAKVHKYAGIVVGAILIISGIIYLITGCFESIKAK